MSQSNIVVLNPYSGEEVGQVPAGTAADIDAAVKQAQEGAEIMRKMPLSRRAEILTATGQILLRETEPLARLITAEAGKTIRETRAEVARAAGIFQLAAEETRRLHGETVPFDAFSSGAGRTGYWTRTPLGVVGAITPWNVPLALAAHKIAPALGGGNAVVFKPAEQTPLHALRLLEALREAGLPEKALLCVNGDGAVVGDALVAHPEVAFLSFTGSREVGLKLPGRAGYKRVTLELGGNSPVIITPSADLTDAAEAIVRGGFAVAGQLCISVQRVLVHESVREALTAELLPRIRALRLGDPNDESTDVGTLISQDACARVAEAVQTAKQAGAIVLIGGERVGRSAYAPTVLTEVDAMSSLAREEAFAPLVLLMPYRTFDEVIALANATPYGLNAGIYTNDLQEALRAADEIDAGSVMINDVPTFRSDLMPYGGRKQSGLGREGVRFAMHEMTEPKLICFRRIPARQ
jgi:glyceraldehyde-3-phosphate dehydrogenase (NADP+)